MRLYRVFAYLIALEVAVQAAAHAYGAAGLGHWIWSDGHTVTKADVEENSGVPITGRWAEELHGVNGAMLIPLLALAFMVVAVIVRRQVNGALAWAGIVLGLVAFQVVLGFATIAVPALGMLHAVNALALLLAALHAARLQRVAAHPGAVDASLSGANT
ncbi:MAG: hypothetical protein WAV00_10000 [Nocardioides sp.]